MEGTACVRILILVLFCYQYTPGISLGESRTSVWYLLASPLIHPTFISVSTTHNLFKPYWSFHRIPHEIETVLENIRQVEC
ncbi:hypothetical protein F4778DRAFT_743353 [Xylariomycetidae sp. FL2044]|nr:hypothetical protein F4778DRAFT_743353 [Xylariomycetidae sp. FL2044]